MTGSSTRESIQPAERHDQQAPAAETMIGRMPKGE
jgi:hypothetical protein